MILVIVAVVVGSGDPASSGFSRRCVPRVPDVWVGRGGGGAWCTLKTLWAFFLRFLLSLLEGPETLKKRRGFLAFFGAFFWRF